MSFGRRGGTAGATITIINSSHLIIAPEYARYQWWVGTPYELIGLACLIVYDGLASLLGLNHLDFKVQSIHWWYINFVSLLAADLFSLVYLWEHNAQHSNRHRLVVSLVN